MNSDRLQPVTIKGKDNLSWRGLSIRFLQKRQAQDPNTIKYYMMPREKLQKERQSITQQLTSLSGPENLSARQRLKFTATTMDCVLYARTQIKGGNTTVTQLPPNSLWTELENSRLSPQAQVSPTTPKTPKTATSKQSYKSRRTRSAGIGER